MFNLKKSEHAVDSFKIIDGQMKVINDIEPDLAKVCLFEIVIQRHLYTVWFQFADVKGFCTAYMCDFRDGWLPSARACVCFGDDYVQHMDAKFPAELKRCCPPGFVVQEEYDEYDQIRCISSSSETVLGQKCPFGKFTSFDLRFDSYEVTEGKLYLSGFQSVVLELNSSAYCVASKLHGSEVPTETVIPTIEHCEIPCNGKQPCLLTCNRQYTHDKAFLDAHNLSRDNLHVLQYFSCPEGYSRRLLNPKENCMDRFELELTGNTVQLTRWDQKLNFEEFCTFKNNSQLQAEICTKSETSEILK